jgi:hypothetical protein
VEGDSYILKNCSLRSEVSFYYFLSYERYRYKATFTKKLSSWYHWNLKYLINPKNVKMASKQLLEWKKLSMIVGLVPLCRIIHLAFHAINIESPNNILAIKTCSQKEYSRLWNSSQLQQHWQQTCIHYLVKNLLKKFPLSKATASMLMAREEDGHKRQKREEDLTFAAKWKFQK